MKPGTNEFLGFALVAMGLADLVIPSLVTFKVSYGALVFRLVAVAFIVGGLGLVLGWWRFL